MSDKPHEKAPPPTITALDSRSLTAILAALIYAAADAMDKPKYTPESAVQTANQILAVVDSQIPAALTIEQPAAPAPPEPAAAEQAHAAAAPLPDERPAAPHKKK